MVVSGGEDHWTVSRTLDFLSCKRRSRYKVLGSDVAAAHLCVALLRGRAADGLGVRGRVARAEQREQHRQQHEAVVEPEHDRQHEHLEEGDEGVGGGAAAHDQRQEGRHPAVEDGRPDGLHAAHRPLQPRARGHDVGVADVDAVVDTQPHRDDDVDAGHDVDVDTPEVEEAHNVHQGDADHGEHEAADLDVGQEHEGDEEDARDS